MQLDALLRSIGRYAPQYGKVKIIYKCTSDLHRRAYEILRQEAVGHLWIEEGDDFKQNVLDAMNSVMRMVTFLVDDDLFYRLLPEFDVSPNVAYAPRLGRNCTRCYNANDRSQEVPTHLWRQVGGEGNLDFDCTLSLDGHVYLLSDVLSYFREMEYANPSQIEEFMRSRIRPHLTFAEHSCLVGIPHNVVADWKGNRSMDGSAEELCRMYLEGQRIDLDAMDFSNVNSVHQDIPYAFRRA